MFNQINLLKIVALHPEKQAYFHYFTKKEEALLPLFFYNEVF